MTDPLDNSYGVSPEGNIAAGKQDSLGSVTALVEAGLSLESGLRALAEEAPTRRLRRTLRRMSDELAAGAAPDEVLSGGGRGFPHYVRGLVRGGVQSGQLGSYLEEFLLAVRRRRSARQNYWLALAYPALLLPLSLLGASVLLAMVVPHFKDIFSDFGVELPQVTLLVLSFGEVLRPAVLSVLLLGIVCLPLIFQMLSLSLSPPVWTRFVQCLPVIGPPSRMRGMSEFCSFLGLLVSGGIPLPDALEMTADAVGDANLRVGTRKLARRVEAGESMSQGALRMPHFSSELRGLFHWESRGQVFGDMLRQAGHVFAARSQVQLNIAALIFPPVLLLVVGGFLGVVVIGLFMPLIKLLNYFA